MIMTRYRKAFVIWLACIIAVIGFFGVVDAFVFAPDQPPIEASEILP
jgi:hypothetical protein